MSKSPALKLQTSAGIYSVNGPEMAQLQHMNTLCSLRKLGILKACSCMSSGNRHLYCKASVNSRGSWSQLPLHIQGRNEGGIFVAAGGITGLI